MMLTVLLRRGSCSIVVGQPAAEHGRLGVDTERPLRIDHIRLARYGRLVNSLGWLFTRKRSREAWLVLMNTGEVRVYDVDKRTPDPQVQAPILSVPSPR